MISVRCQSERIQMAAAATTSDTSTSIVNGSRSRRYPAGASPALMAARSIAHTEAKAGASTVSATSGYNINAAQPTSAGPTASLVIQPP